MARTSTMTDRDWMNERVRRGKGQVVYVPNGGEDWQRRPRSSISVFSADDNGNISRSYSGPETGFNLASWSEDDAIRQGFNGIVANATAQRLDRARRGRATLGSIVGHAMNNGGMVPRELAPSVGMELGHPNFVGGTLTKDGTFISLGIGKDGKMAPMGMVSPFDTLGAMVQSGDYRNANKFVKRFLDGKYTPEQIASTGYSPQWIQGTVNTQASDSSKKLQLEGLKLLAELDKANKGDKPVDAATFFTRAPKLAEAFLNDYERDEEGNIKMVDGVNGPEPVKVQLSPEDASKRAMEYFKGLRMAQADGAAGGENAVQRAIIDGVRALTSQSQADPNLAAMSAEQNRRAYVKNREQSLLIRRDPDGHETWTNGYVVDGKVYDVNGDERQGEFYDERHNLIKPTAPVASAVGDMANGVAGLNNGGTVPEQRANDAAALLAARGKGGANATTQTAQTNAMSSETQNNATQTPTPQTTQLTQSDAVQANTTNATQTNADEEERRRRQDMNRRRNIQASGANEEIAHYYDSIPKEDMQKFRDMIGEDVSTADLYAGKYDQGLRNFAELVGNESIPVELDQIAGLRSRKQVTDRGNAIADVTQGRQKEYDDGVAKIRAEAAKKVARGDWKKADYDEYVKRQESMLSERLRKKYNAIQTAMQ